MHASKSAEIKWAQKVPQYMLSTLKGLLLRAPDKVSSLDTLR